MDAVLQGALHEVRKSLAEVDGKLQQFLETYPNVNAQTIRRASYHVSSAMSRIDEALSLEDRKPESKEFP